MASHGLGQRRLWQVIVQAREGLKTLAPTRYRTRKLAEDAAKFGMTSTIANGIPYDLLSTKLRDTAVIKVMKLILHRVCVLTAEGIHMYPQARDTTGVNVRVFNAAFMIAHPTSTIFESINTLEAELIEAAREMLLVFDKLCIAIISSKRGSDIQESVEEALSFPRVLHHYMAAFKKWKVRLLPSLRTNLMKS